MAATTDRDRIIAALREIVPGRPTGRIWGRLQSATPDHAQEGNAWAGNVEDIADLVLAALARTIPAPGGSMQPSIGSIVHYVSYGTPGGEHAQHCRAAIITETGPSDAVGLAVLNPTGTFFNRAVPYHDGAETPGNPDCPDQTAHGNPFRYCACGWTEAQPKGGTWHWPEPTED